ncbi:MAG: hypothetical protein JO006_04390 [Paucibacter sp.]|nr:hypothetical protein [Roseateles sp.]
MDLSSLPPGNLLHAAIGGAAAMLLLMAALMGLLSLQHRREKHVRLLAAMMLCWLPLAFPMPDWGALLARALVTFFGVRYLLRAMDYNRASLDFALAAQCLLAPLSVLLAPAGWAPTLAILWELLMMAALLAVLGLQWLRGRHRVTISTESPAEEPSRLLPASAVLLLLSPVLTGLIGANTATGWAHLGLPLLMLGLGVQVLLAVTHQRRVAEARNVEAEQQMHERVAEVERSYAAMAEAKVEQVTERERKRIAADLHDDLGAKLLTIVHTSESDRISTLAREALEEMRLSVRGLTGKPVQLLDALGDWRAEVVARLGQANIMAEWKSPAEDIIHTLPARAYVQTTRIVREAVSNIIKHSGATHCTVACNVQGSDFLIVIQDNGQGISSESDARLDRGHGMSSMKSRAKQMHGQCLVESGPGWGTVIRLTIPL